MCGEIVANMIDIHKAYEVLLIYQNTRSNMSTKALDYVQSRTFDIPANQIDKDTGTHK